MFSTLRTRGSFANETDFVDSRERNRNLCGMPPLSSVADDCRMVLLTCPDAISWLAVPTDVKSSVTSVLYCDGGRMGSDGITKDFGFRASAAFGISGLAYCRSDPIRESDCTLDCRFLFHMPVSLNPVCRLCVHVGVVPVYCSHGDYAKKNCRRPYRFHPVRSRHRMPAARYTRRKKRNPYPRVPVAVAGDCRSRVVRNQQGYSVCHRAKSASFSSGTRLLNDVLRAGW